MAGNSSGNATTAVAGRRAQAATTVLDGLDADQRTAVTAPAGPVCILAGAGTGKTRAITHRIAYRVTTGQIRPQHVLAVTFTARAAAEMRERLRLLGVSGVSARTFHAAALRQLRYFAPRLLGGRPLPDIIDSKLRLVTLAAGRSGVRTDRTVARDLASEIEWAKATLTEPADYPVVAAREGRDTPVDAERVAAVYEAYEQAKRNQGVIDFEDLLRAAVWAVEEHPDVAEQVHAQYRHFLVDEYQDVNPVQERLLSAWLGGRDDVTVVGDASQTIYSFTGASSRHLVGFPRRHQGAVVVRLTRDYRSTPQVVGLANAVIRRARGIEAKLRLTLEGQRPAGPEPELRGYDDEPTEAAAVAARCAELVAAGTPPRELAVLFRTNAQSEAYEEALATAGVPYTVQGAERFFERTEVRQAIVALRAASKSVPVDRPLVDAVTEALAAVGWRPDEVPAGGNARERWEAVAALVGLAEEFAAAHPPRSPDADGAPDTDEAHPLEAFGDELSRRAAVQHAPTVEGVTLASFHAAKGLEWDGVFLVGLTDGTLPVTYARTEEQLEEERRLLYVGITRARQWLWLSWATARAPGGRARRPSRFLPLTEAQASGVRSATGRDAGRRRSAKVVSCRVCGATLLDGAERKLGRCTGCPSNLDEGLLARLKEWRSDTATTQKVPAYVVFTDATLMALAERLPASSEELIAIPGIGPRKLGLYGDAVLALIGGAEPADVSD